VPDKRRFVGRASTQRPAGRARVGRAIGRAPTPERAPTDVIRLGPEAAPPVFVDPGGRRRRRLRRLTYLLLAALLLVLLVLWASQFGGPVGPPSTVPCPSAATAGTECRR
jgi:hypothetical protein